MDHEEREIVVHWVGKDVHHKENKALTFWVFLLLDHGMILVNEHEW